MTDPTSSERAASDAPPSGYPLPGSALPGFPPPEPLLMEGVPPIEGVPPRGVSREDVFSLLGSLGAVLTIVTAVMFYFGWQRSAVQAQAMSIDVSLFGFTSQDYILRSISALYIPLLVLAALALGWLWIHAQVLRFLGSDALAAGTRREEAAAVWSRRVAVVCGAVAAACVVFALLAGSTAPPGPVIWLATALRPRQWVVPLVLVTTTLASAYAWWFHRRLRPSRALDRSLWRSLLPAVLVAGTVTLGVFWVIEEYASAVGRGYAGRLAANVDSLARAVVISPYPLGIEAPGVEEEVLGVEGTSEALYRTTGLRLLARSGGKVILVHDGWAPGVGTVVVLADSEALTWQFSR